MTADTYVRKLLAMGVPRPLVVLLVAIVPVSLLFVVAIFDIAIGFYPVGEMLLGMAIVLTIYAIQAANEVVPAREKKK